MPDVIEDWVLVSERLPEKFGKYLVVRGHFYKPRGDGYGSGRGLVTYDTALCEFNPNGYCGSPTHRWFDSGFFYTHWMGPIREMPNLKDFPRLVVNDPCNNR